MSQISQTWFIASKNKNSLLKHFLKITNWFKELDENVNIEANSVIKD